MDAHDDDEEHCRLPAASLLNKLKLVFLCWFMHCHCIFPFLYIRHSAIPVTLLAEMIVLTDYTHGHEHKIVSKFPNK
jgi:hypothetical protein